MTALDDAFLDLVEHAVFVLEPDAKGVPRYAGMNAFARRGIKKSNKEIIGLTAAQLYPGRLGKIAFDHHLATLASGEDTEYEIHLPLSGRQRLVRTTLRCVRDAQGRVIRIVGSSTDISGGQIFREMRTEMETITSEIEEFVSLAAHDLRAPMRNVSQVAEMLREDFQDLGDGKVELIDLLEEVGEKAMRLISDVLAHAQATSCVQETVQFDFGELAADVSAVLDPLNNYRIQHGCGKIEGDRTAVQIILRNLIDNSIKHARPALMTGNRADCSGSLELNICATDLQNGFFEVEVHDNGTGFSAAALQFLKGGKLGIESGFGLLGVRRLIAARGGTVRVANREGGQGAVVAFTLPGRFISSPPVAPREVNLQTSQPG